MNIHEILAQALEDRGFTPTAGRFARDPIRAACEEPGWLRLEAPGSGAPGIARHGDGPWKTIAEDRMGADLPVRVLLENCDPDGQSDTLAAALDWLLAPGCAPGNGQPPRPEILAAALPPAERSVRAGGYLGTIEIECGTALALRCALTSAPMPALSRARREWLDVTLAEWQAMTRMARLVTADSRLTAEVAMTGAPSSCIEGLAAAGAACMRAAIPMLMPALEALLDPGVALAAIESHFPRSLVRARTQKNNQTTGG